MKVDKEMVLWEIGCMAKQGEHEKRKEIVEAILGYFGEQDGMLVLKAILYFKRPCKYKNLADQVLEEMREYVDV